MCCHFKILKNLPNAWVLFSSIERSQSIMTNSVLRYSSSVCFYYISDDGPAQWANTSSIFPLLFSTSITHAHVSTGIEYRVYSLLIADHTFATLLIKGCRTSCRCWCYLWLCCHLTVNCRRTGGILSYWNVW